MKVVRSLRVSMLISLLIAMMSSTLAVEAGSDVSGGGTPGEGISDKQILIGSCSALSGPAKLLGTRQLAGAQAYLNSVNDRGGVFGRKIKLSTYDDCYDPEKAEDCFSKLLRDKVFAAAFFVGTPTAARYVPKIELYGIPLVGIFSGAQLLQEPFRPHIFSVRASYFEETKEQVDNLWNAGHRKIAVLYQYDAFGNAILEGIKRALSEHHATPVATGTFPRNTLEVADGIKSIKKDDPDVVIIVGAYGPAAEIVKVCHEQKFNPLFTTVSFVGTEAFIKSAGKDANGVVITQVMPPYSKDDLPTIALYKRLLRQYYPNESPTFSSLEGFVDAMILVEGLKRAGKDITRAKFIKAMESIHGLDLGLGKLQATYGPTRHKAFDTIYPIVIRGGQIVSVTDWKKL